MTEQEYCDLTDLQLVRQIRRILSQMNCFEEPAKTYRQQMLDASYELSQHLEPQVHVD